MFTYINSHFNFEIPDTMKDTFSIVFTIQTENINIMEEKAELMAKINNIINPEPVDKTVKKITKKNSKKETNNIVV